MKYIIKPCLVWLIFFGIAWSQKSEKIFTVTKNGIGISKLLLRKQKLNVYNGHRNKKEIPEAIPIIGTLEETQDSLRFVPLIPFTWKQQYTLQYGDNIDHFEIELPADYKRLTVTSIFPSSKELPANILKWYIKFSKPISLVNVYDNIHFTHQDNNTLQDALLPLENALLSDDRQLLTVWIDPGRQKRGLIPNQKLGAVFEEEHNYSLVVSKKLKDHMGVTAVSDYKHSFTIKEADRKQPNINLWTLKVPKNNSKNDLEINFKESLDYNSARHSITIIDSEGKTILGNVTLELHESKWVLSPLTTWKKGKHTILINSIIEDLAGNNLNRLFDSKVVNTQKAKKLQNTYKLYFYIK